MILRRITEHVKAQNWTAVALDFLIVVVGVFIGIQVSNWNEVRIEGESKARYLEELALDLEMALAEIDETNAHAQMRVDAGLFLFEGKEEAIAKHDFRRMAQMFSVDNGEHAKPVEHLPLIFSTARVVDEHGATYQELVSTGNISVLRDRSLVRGLSEYYSRYQEIQTGDEWNWKSSHEIKLKFQARGIAFTKAIPAQELVAILEDDPLLEASLVDAAKLSQWQINRLSQLRSATEAVLALLKEAQQ